MPTFRNVLLNFCDTLTVDSIRGSLGQVLSFTRGSQLLTVTLERDYVYGETFVFTVYYHGHPCGDAEDIFRLVESPRFNLHSSLNRNALPSLTDA